MDWKGTVKTKVRCRVNKKFIIKKIEEIYYKNKIRAIKIMKNYIDSMLNYKVN